MTYSLSPAELRRKLDETTNETEARSYLGMSHIADCPFSLYRYMKRGPRPPSLTTRRFCHEGIVHERDVIERLWASGLTISDEQAEIVSNFDPRFRGHIDAALGDILIEIKSISTNDILERVKREGPKAAHMWQIQAYMRYSRFDLAYVIYKVRATGGLWVIPVPVDNSIGMRLESKAKMVLDALDGKTNPPRCSCGHCSRFVE